METSWSLDPVIRNTEVTVDTMNGNLTLRENPVRTFEGVVIVPKPH